MKHKKRFHAISWDKVTVPKWLGGLGVRKLEDMNNACLAKLNWKYYAGSTGVGFCVVNTDMRGIIVTMKFPVQTQPYGKALVMLRPMVKQFSFWRVGDGCVIDAWHDAWIEEGLCIEQITTVPQ
ncbi:hypothetical protein TSUD_204540 [Trifolium subterraneum]|uniref:Uncharacterized protein n=1 Tax=Trifolium subterraneum TaxID=3900 RepID=A0A2Z6P3Q6_TRISU|nr:hypothetical protein TSUD_204540 [Trifolium subterraneum]